MSEIPPDTNDVVLKKIGDATLEIVAAMRLKGLDVRNLHIDLKEGDCWTQERYIEVCGPRGKISVHIEALE